MTSATAARLEAIFLRPSARSPVRSVARARAVAGVGLEGDHANGGRRQVTLLSREAWDAVCTELAQTIEPAVRRANLLVSGLDLGTCIGHRLRIGDVVIDVLGETRPCELLDDGGRLGLAAALRRDRRAGVYGVLRAGGDLQVGSAVDRHPADASAT